MTSQQNLCLICCYSFQEKRSRFISDEARQSFSQFSTELGFPFLEETSFATSRNNSSLNLAFGESITVCGDCLSLVVVYVQRREVQREKEAKVLELQKAVCKAIRELTGIVEDVQSHLNRLHSTVRMGDDATLEEFIGRKPGGEGKNKKEEAKVFRAKVLSLNTGTGAFKTKDVLRPTPQQPIVIKAEPPDLEDNLDLNYSDNDNMNEDFGGEDLNLDRNIPISEEEQLSSSKMATSTCRRSLRRRPVRKNPPYQNTFSEVDEENDNQDLSDAGAPFSDDNLHPDSSDEEEKDVKPERPPKRYPPRARKTPAPTRRLLKCGTLLSPPLAAQWKESLLHRITSNLPSSPPSSSCPLSEKQFTLLPPDHLQLGPVLVKIHESRRMLECRRCYKMYFHERDAPFSSSPPLESLMRSHILEKHTPPKRPRPPVEELEMIEYTSHTKSKITFKLADSHRYSYTRRCGKKDGGGACYYRCDFRKGNCSAGVVFKNGKYLKLRKGWSANGLHACHEPDKERTNRQIALGKAKYLYLTDDSKTIDDVCKIVLEGQGEEGMGVVPITKLKRAMVYSKYGSRGMAPEEKRSQILQCSYCGKIYKEGRGLSRHVRVEHKRGGEEGDGGKGKEEEGKVDHRAIRRKKWKMTGNKKKKGEKVEGKGGGEVKKEEEAAPSIVFNDPSAANNFVNRCISAIMQQVGVSVSPGGGGGSAGGNKGVVSSVAAVSPSEASPAGPSSHWQGATTVPSTHSSQVTPPPPPNIYSAPQGGPGGNTVWPWELH